MLWNKNPLYNSFVANANPLIWLLIKYISHGTYSGLDTNYTVTKFGIYKRAYSDLGKETPNCMRYQLFETTQRISRDISI